MPAVHHGHVDDRRLVGEQFPDFVEGGCAYAQAA
jgi:hypothetical protein